MRALLAISLLCAASAQATSRSRAESQGLAYFEMLVDEGSLSETAIQRMLAGHQVTGRLPTAIVRANGPAELRRKTAADGHLATVDHGRLASLLAEGLRTRGQDSDRLTELRHKARPEHPALSFIRLAPERPVELWDPDTRAPVPFQLQRPLEVMTTLVTRGQWFSRLNIDPLLEGRDYGSEARYPMAPVVRHTWGAYQEEHFDRVDGFLATLDAENPSYRHRLPTPLEWMYFATDRGTDPNRLVAYDGLRQHAWRMQDYKPPAMSHQVATLQPLLLADAPIYDVVGLLAELVRPHQRTWAMGGLFITPPQLEPKDHPLVALVSGAHLPNLLYGIRPVREMVR